MIYDDILAEIYRKRYAVMNETGKEPEIVVYLDHVTLPDLRQDMRARGLFPAGPGGPKGMGGTINGYKYYLVDSIHHGWKVFVA